MNVYRYALAALIALVPVLPMSASTARACKSPHLSASCDKPARWADRYDARDARLAITTEGKDAMLIVTDDVVAVQLSDRVLHAFRKKSKEVQKEDDDNVLAQAIKTVVFGSIREILDHSAEVPLRDLRDASYQDGRLVLVASNGEHLFEDTKVNDRLVLADFSEHDARAFVREFQHAKARLR